MPPQRHTASRTRSEKPKNATTHTPQENASAQPMNLQRAALDPTAASPGTILALQRTVGNQAVQRLIQRGRASSATPTIQRKVTVDGTEYAKKKDFTTLWGTVEQYVTEKNRRTAKGLLKSWVTAAAEGGIFSGQSENREYGTVQEVASALDGEIESAENLSKETDLAKEAIKSDYIKTNMASFVQKVKEWKNTKKLTSTGRYAQLYYGGLLFTDSLKKAVSKSNKQGSITKNAAILADVSLAARKYYKRDLKGLSKDDSMADARGTHWNPKESAEWTKQARIHKVPLSAGPSATTANLMNLAEELGATTDEKVALAWSIFAFWNQDYSMKYSGTHRFHEVMAVAVKYGVPYNEFVYPEAIPDGKEKVEEVALIVDEIVDEEPKIEDKPKVEEPKKEEDL